MRAPRLPSRPPRPGSTATASSTSCSPSTRSRPTASAHGGGRRGLLLWRNGSARSCARSATRGRFDDPLAGRVAPRADDPRGRGLWIANQLCDLVQIRSTPAAPPCASTSPSELPPIGGKPHARTGRHDCAGDPRASTLEANERKDERHVPHNRISDRPEVPLRHTAARGRRGCGGSRRACSAAPDGRHEFVTASPRLRNPAARRRRRTVAERVPFTGSRVRDTPSEALRERRANVSTEAGGSRSRRSALRCILRPWRRSGRISVPRRSTSASAGG